MTMRYDKTAKKKATTLSINSDLLKKVKELNINISATLQDALEEKLVLQKQKNWQKENKKWIEDYNKHIKEDGLISDELRSW